MKSILILAVCFVCLFTGIQGQEKRDMNNDSLLQYADDDGITGAVRDKIISHLKQNVPRTATEPFIGKKEDENNLIVTETSAEPFPANVKFYSLHHRGFSHWSEIYAEYEGNLYTSLNKNDFENFLKNYDFLKKGNSLELFVAAYKNFNINDSAIQPDRLVSGQYLAENRKRLMRYGSGNKKIAFSEIHPPLEKKVKNTEIAFYVDNPLLDKITLIKVSISADYNFYWKSKIFQK